MITVKPRLFRREMRCIVSSYHLVHCWLVLAFTCTGSGILLEKPRVHSIFLTYETAYLTPVRPMIFSRSLLGVRLVFWCSSAAACRMSQAGTALGLPDFGLSRSPSGPSLLNRSTHRRIHRAVTSKTAAMFSAECPSSSTARTAISLVLTFRSFSVRIAELSSSRRFMITVEDRGSISFVTVDGFCRNYFCASLYIRFFIVWLNS